MNRPRPTPSSMTAPLISFASTSGCVSKPDTISGSVRVSSPPYCLSEAACLPPPSLDVVPTPNAASRKHGNRLGEPVSARVELVDPLGSDAQHRGHLGRAHKIELVVGHHPRLLDDHKVRRGD